MSTSTKVIILLLLLIALSVASYKTFFEQPEPTASATTPVTCENGTVECPNNCLKREQEGWRQMDVPGHPPTDIWMQFVDARGHAVAYNQHHIGHVIELKDGKYTDVGVCPVCKGTTRVCK